MTSCDKSIFPGVSGLREESTLVKSGCLPSISFYCKSLQELPDVQVLTELHSPEYIQGHDRELLGVLYQEVYEVPQDRSRWKKRKTINCQDVVERAIEMPLSRMKWGDLEMGQPLT